MRIGIPRTRRGTIGLGALAIACVTSLTATLVAGSGAGPAASATCDQGVILLTLAGAQEIPAMVPECGVTTFPAPGSTITQVMPTYTNRIWFHGTETNGTAYSVCFGGGSDAQFEPLSVSSPYQVPSNVQVSANTTPC